VHTQYSDAADGPAYRRMLAWAVRCTAGRRVWALEETGSFAAGLVTVLAEAGEDIVEIQNNKRSRGAKNDRIDAVQAARTALAQPEQATPRDRGLREALRQVLVTRQGILISLTKAINELKSLIVVAPEHLRAQLRGLGLAKQLDRIDRFTSPPGATIEHRVTVRTLRSIAARIRFLINQAAELDVELLVLVPQHPAGSALLAEPGVGPVVAAQLLVSWSHRGRVRNEAAFASLAGVAPLEASSGQRTRHRLSRMGDRNLNRALHTVAITRLRCHVKIPATTKQDAAPKANPPRRSPESEAHSCPPFLPPHSSRHPPREHGGHARQGGLTKHRSALYQAATG
jgi:transposase